MRKLRTSLPTGEGGPQVLSRISGSRCEEGNVKVTGVSIQGITTQLCPLPDRRERLPVGRGGRDTRLAG